MKVGIIVTTNYSDEFRPNGLELINAFLYTLSQSIKHEIIVYLFNNESTNILALNFQNQPNIKIDYEYVQDQKKRGLTGTWNDGVNKAVRDNCDVIVVCCDDILFNSTINDFVEIILSDEYRYNAIFGPVTNGVLSHHQYRKEPGDKIIEFNDDHHVLNGFCFGFKSEIADIFKYDEKHLFDPNIKWGGNEEEFMNRVKSKGGKLVILEPCWVHHHKIRGWKKVQNGG